MKSVRCRVVRPWLQAPDELSVSEKENLGRHLASCAECAALVETRNHLDTLLLSGVRVPPGASSVRANVLGSLGDVRTPAPCGGARQTRARLKPGLRWGAPLLAAGAIAVSVLFPRPGSSPPGLSVAVGAGWHVVRPEIAFPLAIDARRPNHMLAGAWGQVYVSFNAGSSWQPTGALPPGLVVRALGIDDANGRRYIVAVKHSVFVSDDAGAHWHAVARLLPGAMNMFLLQDPAAPRTWYLGPSVLWRSSDGGRTWRRGGKTSIFAPYGIQALTFAPKGELYTGIWGRGVAVSKDGGRSWLLRSTGLAPDVMDVSVAGRVLWAATDRGVFRSTDGGATWSRSGPETSFYATSILAPDRYELAGGNGGIFRSDDGGRHWSASTAGLPFDSYVYNLVPDPQRPGRVYACLNTDGIFRSDDAGRHWVQMDSGLPLSGHERAPRSVLFRHGGALYITDASGTDPSRLTVDQSVSVASPGPDGAAVAYVTGNSSGWSVRILSAGGSAARTLISGAGSPPRTLLWSPSSSALTVVVHRTAWTLDFHAGRSRWRLSPDEQLLGWNADGRTLVGWLKRPASLVQLNPRTGRRQGGADGTFPTRPVPSHDAARVATVADGRLTIRGWHQSTGATALLGGSCTPRQWSDDAQRLLVSCGRGLEVRDAGGRMVRRVSLPSIAFWAPGSHTDLLFFHQGLRLLKPSGEIRLLVRSAGSVQPVP